MNLNSEILTSKLPIQYDEPKCKKWFDLNEIWYAGVFVIADYKSELKIWKFVIVYPKWRIESP